LFERSNGAFVSTWNQADRPPPRVSRPRTPTFEAALVTSHFEVEGAAVGRPLAPLMAAFGPVAPSEYFQKPKLMFK